MDSKVCRGCHVDLPLSSFDQSYDRRAPGRLRSRCKACYLRQRRERYATDIEYRTRRKRGVVLSVHGLSRSEYAGLLDRQNGVCAICDEGPTSHKRPNLVVDHDHATGLVRGLLCSSCNLILGHAKDNPKRLIRAVDYLVETSAR